MPYCYVMVWENNTFGHRAVPGRMWPGHASINLGDAFAKPREDYEAGDPKNYVSWFPAEGANFGVKDMFSLKKQLGTPLSSLVWDILSERYLPDHVIRLDSTDEKIAKMLAEWISIRLKPGGNTYQSFRQNCSTIVSRVLYAGGYYGKSWAVNNNFVWTPADALRLAESAGGSRMKWTDVLEVLKQGGLDLSAYQIATYARDKRLCSTGAPCKF